MTWIICVELEGHSLQLQRQLRLVSQQLPVVSAPGVGPISDSGKLEELEQQLLVAQSKSLESQRQASEANSLVQSLRVELGTMHENRQEDMSKVCWVFLEELIQF